MNEREIAKKIAGYLDRGTADLKAGTAYKLQLARQKALARLSRLFRDADFRRRLIEATDAAAMYRVIAEEDAKY